jgi:amino acid transporter
LAVYAYAFGSYGASFAPADAQGFWRHVLITAAIVALVGLNVLAAPLVVRSENLFNALKMLLLGGFVLAGLLVPMDWSRFAPEHMVSPLGLVAGAMLIFLNYEGFELIANASGDVADRRRSLPIAYVGGVLLVILIYVLIVVVVIGHLDFAEVSRDPDTALSAAGRAILGETGRPATWRSQLRRCSRRRRRSTPPSTAPAGWPTSSPRPASCRIASSARSAASTPRARWSAPCSPSASPTSCRSTRSPRWAAPASC